jgi:glutaredoxin-related protein
LFIGGGAKDPATGRMTRLLDAISVKYQIFDLNADASLRQSLADSLEDDRLPLLFVDAHLIGDTDLIEDLLGSGVRAEIFDATRVSYDRATAALRIKP